MEHLLRRRCIGSKLARVHGNNICRRLEQLQGLPCTDTEFRTASGNLQMPTRMTQMGECKPSQLRPSKRVQAHLGTARWRRRKLPSAGSSFRPRFVNARRGRRIRLRSSLETRINSAECAFFSQTASWSTCTKANYCHIWSLERLLFTTPVTVYWLPLINLKINS